MKKRWVWGDFKSCKPYLQKAKLTSAGSVAKVSILKELGMSPGFEGGAL